MEWLIAPDFPVMVFVESGSRLNHVLTSIPIGFEFGRWNMVEFFIVSGVHPTFSALAVNVDHCGAMIPSLTDSWQNRTAFPVYLC